MSIDINLLLLKTINIITILTICSRQLMRVRGEEKVKSLSISRVEPPEASHSHTLATVVGLLVILHHSLVETHKTTKMYAKLHNL